MAPKILTNVSNLTKESIAELYFLSLGEPQTRKLHNMALLTESRGGLARIPPSVHDTEIDFTCWYGGVTSVAQGIDPGVDLPPLKEMVGFITNNFEKVKTAIAA
jgi:hypothetical protein